MSGRSLHRGGGTLCGPNSSPIILVSMSSEALEEPVEVVVWVVVGK